MNVLNTKCNKLTRLFASIKIRKEGRIIKYYEGEEKSCHIQKMKKEKMIITRRDAGRKKKEGRMIQLILSGLLSTNTFQLGRLPDSGSLLTHISEPFFGLQRASLHLLRTLDLLRRFLHRTSKSLPQIP